MDWCAQDGPPICWMGPAARVLPLLLRLDRRQPAVVLLLQLGTLASGTDVSHVRWREDLVRGSIGVRRHDHGALLRREVENPRVRSPAQLHLLSASMRRPLW